MIGEILDREAEFGIVWLSDDELKGIGCACEVARVLERFDDGRLNILCQGTRPFRLVERQEGLPYPAGTVEFASYSPKQIELSVKAAAPSVLLLNDKYDPDWKVSVNGQPAKLLRCNSSIMIWRRRVTESSSSVTKASRKPSTPAHGTRMRPPPPRLRSNGVCARIRHSGQITPNTSITRFWCISE